MKQVINRVGINKWVYLTKRALAWLGVALLIISAAYLGYTLINIRAEMRVQNAYYEAHIQVLEAEIENLKAETVGVELEKDKLTDPDNLPSKYQAR